MKPTAIWAKPVTSETCTAHPRAVFVLDDDLAGTSLPPELSGMDNIFGVPTFRGRGAPFGDRSDERMAILDALETITVLAETYTLLFPAAGIGIRTGMKDASPNLWSELSSTLMERFRFDNGSCAKFALSAGGTLIPFNTLAALEYAAATWYPEKDIQVYVSSPYGLEINYVRYLPNKQGGGRFVYTMCPDTEAKLAL